VENGGSHLSNPFLDFGFNGIWLWSNLAERFLEKKHI
jgi:hypothetical protein